MSISREEAQNLTIAFTAANPRRGAGVLLQRENKEEEELPASSK